MAPEVRAAVEGVIILSTVLILVLVVVSLLMMRGVSKSARCRYCEHCRRAENDEKALKAKRRHMAYHASTNGTPSTCQNNDCPGRR